MYLPISITKQINQQIRFNIIEFISNNFYFYLEMHHRPQVHFSIPNQSQEPTFPKHKLLRNSIKIVSKSSQKNIIKPKFQQPYNLGATCRLSQSGVNKDKSVARKGLKIDIDTRLNKAYSSIAKHASIQLLQNKPNTSIDRSFPFPSILEKNHQNTNTSSTSVYKQLPYQLLRTYIQSIYEEYSIKDPLETLNDFPQVKQHDIMNQAQQGQGSFYLPSTPPRPVNLIVDKNKISTKKKLLLLKNHFIAELNTVNTQKKLPSRLQTQKQMITETSEFNYPLSLNSHVFPQQQGQKAGISFNEHPQNTYKQQHEGQTLRINNFQESSVKKRHDTMADTKLSISDVHYHNFSSIHYKPQDSTYENSRNVNNFGNQQTKVNQVFRYCFVCQEAILEMNICYHERSCKGLHNILSTPHLTTEELMNMINQKIFKIENQLNSLLQKIEPKQISFQFSQIKETVLGWISNIRNEIKQEQGFSSKRNQDVEQRIDKLVNNTRLIKTFELIRKLKWFSHLRRNFMIQVNRIHRAN